MTDDKSENIAPDDDPNNPSSADQNDANGASEDESKGDNKKEKPKPALKSNSKGIKLDQYLIYEDLRLPEYDAGPVQAYHAKDEKGDGEYIALVCEPALTPRHGKRNAYNKIVSTHVSKLISHGIVFWPPARQERYIFIYQKNLGKKLLQPGQPPALGLKPELVCEIILPALMEVMQEMRQQDLIHGSINIHNLYDGNEDGYKNVMLWECLSTPASYNQDPAFEVVEMAMADPISKGRGGKQDDMYSLGVTLAALMRHHDPFEGLSVEDIILKKNEQGSYVAVTGGERFTGAALEILRGLLQDETENRWTYEEVLVWMGGRRLSPKQTTKKASAPRHINFAGKKHLYPSMLAMDLSKYKEETKRIVEEGDLKHWILRALDKSSLYDIIQDAIALSVQGDELGYPDRLASNISIVLDPGAPIRFKNLAMHVDGVGTAMAEAYVLGKDKNVFAELISNNIVPNWAKRQYTANVDLNVTLQNFDFCKKVLKQTNIGFGLERCLYMLNTDAHCMSDKLKNYHVLNPDDILFAFEDMCERGHIPHTFIDRHIAAFLAEKDNKSIELCLHDLNSKDPCQVLLGNIVCLGTLQRRLQLPPFPAVASALSDQFDLLYARYHDKQIREKMRKDIDRHTKAGDIAKIAALFDDIELRNTDLVGFKKAMGEYKALKKELTYLEAQLEHKKSYGIATGQEVAALASSLIACVTILILGFIYFSGTGL